MVDPYNLFNISHIFPDEAKIKCFNRTDATTPRGNYLWKNIAFRRDPSPNIFLGDSRMAVINIDLLEEKIGGKVSNLAIPGGNLRTIIDMFWMAAKTAKLENVFIQIDFKDYNDFGNKDLFGRIIKLLDNPLSYFFNWKYLLDSFSVFYYTMSRDENYVSRSFENRQDNWKLSELYLRNVFAQKYFYPVQLKAEMTKISNFCNEEKINLIFVIAPNYYEEHNIVKSFNRENDYNRFINDISSLGMTINLNNGLAFSLDKSNYSDYYHIRSTMKDTLISMIFQSPLLKDYFSN
jgi:hypothetical protein